MGRPGRSLRGGDAERAMRPSPRLDVDRLREGEHQRRSTSDAGTEERRPEPACAIGVGVAAESILVDGALRFRNRIANGPGFGARPVAAARPASPVSHLLDLLPPDAAPGNRGVRIECRVPAS